jgi:hypothetical protein
VGAWRGLPCVGHRRGHTAGRASADGLAACNRKGFGNSLSLYPVDLVDLTAASDSFRGRVGRGSFMDRLKELLEMAGKAFLSVICVHGEIHSEPRIGNRRE